MLKQCILAEWEKMRHSHLWMVLMILPLVSVFIGCANFLMNQGTLQKEWYSLWSQVGLFYGEFFFPILIAIICSFQCRLEHQNKNWNMVMTAPVSVASIFLAKLVVVAVLLAMVQGFFFFLYVCGGKLVGLQASLPGEWPGWLFRGWIAAITISVFQLAISMRIRSFAAPVGIGLCATFFGLGMYVMHASLFFPHSLLTSGMGVLSQEGLTAGSSVVFYMMNLLYMVVISAGVIYQLRKRDVVA
ncbi:ABC transporter permease [Brevibacillus ginsengisoli]|uniref:ABC transporter permease n=1 Tax=Brevibacillus ginsengisoli TaxID=363854 RepID=UPI003CE84189